MEQDADLDPTSPQPTWSPAVSSVFPWAQRSSSVDQLEQELREARTELEALHALLEDIPRIFESKFQQRLEPILHHNAQLRGELQQLRELQQAPAAIRQPQLPEVPVRPRLRYALRHAFGLAQTPGEGSGEASTQASTRAA
jgi:hypothetical protein